MAQIGRKITTSLAKIEVLRKIFPSLGIRYKAFILNDHNARIVYNAEKTGRKRAINFWKWAPRKYWGGSILNLFGLSLLRYYFHNLKYKARFLFKKLPYQELKKDGIEIKKRAFSPELIKSINDFYKKYQKDSNQYFEDFSELIICDTKRPNHSKRPNEKTQDFVDMTDKILKEANIRELGKEITGKNVKIYPFISILHSTSDPKSKEQGDGQNTPHVDVFYPSHKLFVYLNDVNDDNGAFRYFKGSHEFSFKNAINYYKDTFRYYFKGGNKAIYPTDASVGIHKNNYEWFHAHGKPGDGVLFNVQGIHRRGEFKKDKNRERVLVLVDFRQVEVPFQKLAANAA